ncbi:MAG: DUF3822 family protein, partial [Bacteroidia bacterium]|nr:DUF3822 family protein [Bacteroidia bacterium]MDW8134805.1 DUF3822 family protein [Bacteroidia bacterium]
MVGTKPIAPQDLYTSSAFNPASLNIYHLGVHLEPENLYYLVSTAQHEPLMVRLYKNRDGLEVTRFIEAVWQQDEFVRKRFAKAFLLLDTDRWLVVPSEYVPDGQEPAYLRAYYEIISEEGARSYAYKKEVLKGSGAAFLYVQPVSLSTYFESRLSAFQVLHASFRYVQLTQYLVQQHLNQRPFAGIVWLFLSKFYYVLF